MTVTEPGQPTADGATDHATDHVGTPAVPVGVGAVIEPMRRRHLRGVLRIEGRTSTTPWSLGLFVAELGRGEQRAYLVARVDGRVVGYAGALLVAGEAHVTTIAVDPDLQGHSIGRRLLLALVRRCVALGCGAMTLEVRASNEAALALYRIFDFVPAGVRKGYYSKPVEDALVLWAHDIALPEYTRRLAAIEAALPTPLVVDGLDERPAHPLPAVPSEGPHP